MKSVVSKDIFNNEFDVVVKAKKVTPIQVEKVEESFKPYMTINTNIQLKPHSVTIVKSFYKSSTETKEQNENSRANLIRDNQYNGYMSDNTSRSVKKITENWLTSIDLNTKLKYKGRESVYPTFVTLTLPSKQVHHDNTIKSECLDPMIEWLKKMYYSVNGVATPCGVNAYLWRAESQKNGNLHFHILIDRWVDYEKLRKKWNQIIERLDYVSMYQAVQNRVYRKGFMVREDYIGEQIKSIRKRAKKKGQSLSMKNARFEAEKAQRESYNKGVQNNWSDPNTTDIHKLGSITSISAYVTKYVCKRPDELPLKENQRIVDRDGKKKLQVYKIENNVEFVIDETDYKPIYDTRTVKGRIWGRSDSLFNAKPDCPKVIALETIVDFCSDGRKGVRYSRSENRLDNDYLDYAENLGKVIDADDIKQVNDNIDSDFVYVVPLKDKQITYLKDLSPNLHERYILHYKDLFFKLYPNYKDVA